MKPVEVKRDDGVELETQVILRLPEEVAKLLREAIREGANNLKDRLFVKLESDLRYGEVRFDHWLLHARVVDLPSILESLKTIDNKSFYKTADICQMIICKLEPDVPSAAEEESPNKNKKKDPNKVDKKFLWPHGITPPCKNLRKRRFRKTLKKKFVEAPEIEKEVKRLLRADNEAVNCKWDLITEEDDHKSIQLDMDAQDSSVISMGTTEKVKKSKGSKERSSDRGNDSGQMPRDIDIFGEDLSSSDEDDHHNNINVDLDDSRLSADDSRLSDYSLQGGNGQMKMETEFNDDAIFSSPVSRGGDGDASLSLNRSHSFYENERPESDDNDNDITPQVC
ncbi:Transcription initiation factor TFIID subunit 7, partial [Pseudolycoriella hygida]